MLQLFANALLIAARFDPPHHPQRPRIAPEDVAAPARRWRMLSGQRR